MSVAGEFPYAKCFICSEVGHLSRSCPDNPRGLYPRGEVEEMSKIVHLYYHSHMYSGGGCKVCGSVEHLKANCPLKNSSNKNSSECNSAYQFLTHLVCTIILFPVPSDSTTSGNAYSADAIVSADVRKFTTSTPPKKKSEVSSRRKERVVKF